MKNVPRFFRDRIDGHVQIANTQEGNDYDIPVIRKKWVITSSEESSSEEKGFWEKRSQDNHRRYRTTADKTFENAYSNDSFDSKDVLKMVHKILDKQYKK